MPDLAYVNGKIAPLRAATVRVQDRGFLFADGAYEVMRSYEGRIFQLQAHLERLASSLRGLRIRPPVTRRQLVRVLETLLRRSRYRDARLYVQVTRGAAPRQPAFPRGVRPTLMACVEKVPAPAPRSYRRGVAVITMPDPRWRRCDLKTIALLPNVLAKQAALDAGAHEAIFVGPDGSVREGSSANVFVVRGRTLRTHPLGPEILPGVSRAVVLAVAREAGLRIVERRFTRATLLAADEVFLSSTMQEVLPVVRVDGRRIGDGRPGEIGRDLRRRFRARAVGPSAAARRRAPARRSRAG